ncbi:MAG: hypothetical protein KF900_06125 [Bacteroidetes bacterium]|nr:hypothetical protein [Bacteroidota bacterium]
MKSILFVIFCCVISFSSCSQKPHQANIIDDKHLIHSFKDKSGNPLGNAYAKYTADNDSIFTSLIIISQSDTLYKIDNTKLISKKGVDDKVSEERFLGYKCVLKKGDYFILVMVNEYGEGISDDITIEWNYSEKLFELLKRP